MNDNYDIYGKYGCWWEGGTGVSPDGHQCGECYPDYEDECPHLEKRRERRCGMKTNRQWLESLTDKQLAEFLTFGLLVRSTHYIGDPFIISISQIAMRYTASVKGIEKWLSMPQDYEIEEGDTK